MNALRSLLTTTRVIAVATSIATAPMLCLAQKNQNYPSKPIRIVSASAASQTDIVFDDAKRLAQAVEAAGGELILRVWRGQTHVWERTESVEARQSIELAAAFIAAHAGAPAQGA